MGRKKISFQAAIILIVGMILFSCIRGEDYRKKIEKKGMSFTQEAFLNEVRSGNKEHMELFIKAGMDINSRDKDGSTALMIVSEKGDLEMAQLLIQNGADVDAKNIDGYTALMYVAYKGNLQIAELLIKNRADINVRDKDGWTALRYALIQRGSAMVELLKKARDPK